MKILRKISIILIIAICVFAIIPQNMSMAASGGTAGALEQIKPDSTNTTQLSSGLAETVSKLLGFLQVASGFIAVLMIALTGFNYIISTPEVKDEMKKKMLPIIIGLVLVFGAVSVAKFILGVVGG